MQMYSNLFGISQGDFHPDGMIQQRLNGFIQHLEQIYSNVFNLFKSIQIYSEYLKETSIQRLKKLEVLELQLELKLQSDSQSVSQSVSQKKPLFLLWLVANLSHLAIATTIWT